MCGRGHKPLPARGCKKMLDLNFKTKLKELSSSTRCGKLAPDSFREFSTSFHRHHLTRLRSVLIAVESRDHMLVVVPDLLTARRFIVLKYGNTIATNRALQRQCQNLGNAKQAGAQFFRKIIDVFKVIYRTDQQSTVIAGPLMKCQESDTLFVSPDDRLTVFRGYLAEGARVSWRLMHGKVSHSFQQEAAGTFNKYWTCCKATLSSTSEN